MEEKTHLAENFAFLNSLRERAETQSSRDTYNVQLDKTSFSLSHQYASALFSLPKLRIVGISDRYPSCLVIVTIVPHGHGDRLAGVIILRMDWLLGKRDQFLIHRCIGKREASKG